MAQYTNQKIIKDIRGHGGALLTNVTLMQAREECLSDNISKLNLGQLLPNFYLDDCAIEGDTLVGNWSVIEQVMNSKRHIVHGHGLPLREAEKMLNAKLGYGVDGYLTESENIIFTK